jgi:hypothetical protein
VITPLFTLSRQDIYDYLRCPKIVSFKAFRATITPKEVKSVEDQKAGITRRIIIGAIGEAAAAIAFSPIAVALSRKQGKEGAPLSDIWLLKRARIKLSELGVQLDAEMEELLKQTVEGLTLIRKYLTEEYGELEIIGRGESRNGPMPGLAMPDFVAISPELKQPILIEVKNAARASPSTDRFQAVYYNTVAREVGVVVLEERLESGRLVLTPKSFHESVAETVLVYPRLEKYERVSDTLKLRKELLEEVWRAKQLGFIGRTPHTDCDALCPHHRLSRRLGIELPEGNIETATPLPLIYAEGLVECDADLDAKYLRDFLFRFRIGSTIFDLMPSLRVMERYSRLDEKKKIIEFIANKTGLPTTIIETFFHRAKWPDAETLQRTMASEIEPWEKILGKDKIKRSLNSIQGLSTRIYTLPQKSIDFVRQSWKQWQK